MDVMTFGVLALSFMLISAGRSLSGKNFCGFCASIVTIILTVLCGCSWKKMLEDSGKDTALLGFDSYPAAVIILVLLLMCSAVLFIISAAAIARKAKSK